MELRSAKVSGSRSGRYTSIVRASGSIIHPSRAPLAVYSCIFARRTGSRSERERSSITNAGQRCQYPSRLSGFNCRISSFPVQEPSGKRRAPLGSTNPPEDSPTSPRRSCAAQRSSCLMISRFRARQRKCRRHYNNLPGSGHFKGQIRVFSAEIGELLVGHGGAGQSRGQASIVKGMLIS